MASTWQRPGRSGRRGSAALALAAALAAAQAEAAAHAPVGQMCEQAAATAAAETGVPLALLRAIMLVETGRHDGAAWFPWPWTANIAGRGDWYPDRQTAVRAIAAAVEAGASPDIGCFQLNMRWHGHHFPSIDAMIAPAANARHAARFLDTLRAELGSWEAAAGAYHSRDPERAAAYAARVRRHWTPEATPAVAAPAEGTRRAFPLLDPARTARGPSLFPADVTDAGALRGAVRPLIGGG